MILKNPFNSFFFFYICSFISFFFLELFFSFWILILPCCFCNWLYTKKNKIVSLLTSCFLQALTIQHYYLYNEPSFQRQYIYQVHFWFGLNVPSIWILANRMDNTSCIYSSNNYIVTLRVWGFLLATVQDSPVVNRETILMDIELSCFKKEKADVMFFWQSAKIKVKLNTIFLR